MANNVISERFNDLGLDGQPARLGIMGGTFDPIHLGHLLCAEAAREALALDAVLFIPTGTPNFKQDQEITDPAMRLEMCRLACMPNPHFDVSDIEIARGGITYAIDTVRALRQHFPDNVELFFIVGSDSALTIPKWRDALQIAHLVHFVAVTRPGYDIDTAFTEQLSDADAYTIDFVEAATQDISSHQIRRRAANGQSLRYLVPSAVRTYIIRHNLYQTASGILGASADQPDALTSEFFEERAAEVKTRVDEKRAQHIFNVAEAALDLARTYGVDERKAHLAGLLHDWDKGYDDEGIRSRIVELGLVDRVDPWVVEHMPQVLHGPTAAAALARDFPSIPDDVLQAIDRHTTAAFDMEDLDKIIYVADAIEESRQFGRIDELRGLVGNATLDELFTATYEYWTFRLIERKKVMHPDTVAIWNEYMLEESARKGAQRDR